MKTQARVVVVGGGGSNAGNGKSQNTKPRFHEEITELARKNRSPLTDQRMKEI